MTEQNTVASLEQQELASRLLLTRRQLMDRVENSLRPLFRGQLLQIFLGIIVIALGARCWAENQQFPHRFASGVIMHVYGVLMIIAAAAVSVRTKMIDYSKPVPEIRQKLDQLRLVYLIVGPIIGFAWWLIWIPLCVVVGFDAVVVYRNSFLPSLVIGIVGLIVSAWLYWRAVRPDKTTSELWKRKLSGSSIATAYKTLDEIESANIN